MSMPTITANEYHVRVASTVEDVSKVKSIDDMAFVGHRGITESELLKVQEKGVLLILYHATTGYVVGEAQLLFQPIPEIPHTFTFPV